MKSPVDAELTRLASNFTVRDYKAARDAEDRKKIADGIRRRFTERYIAPANQNYMNSLVTLQASLESAAQTPSNDAATSQSMNNATAARIAARQLAQTFRIDPDGHVETAVLKLLLDPITNAEALIRSVGPAELNGKVPFAWGPHDTDFGIREFAIRDPDGYTLVFAERT